MSASATAGVASGDHVSAPAAHQPVRRAQAGATQAPKLPPPNAILRITLAQIRRYATISGDRNPIHTNALGAKLFGFPTVIAHGMFSAAAILANLEGQLPTAVSYAVKFGKPVVLPANAGVYVDRSPTAGIWRCATSPRVTRT